MSTMNSLRFFFLLAVIHLLRHAPAVSAAQYTVINDARQYPGGRRFDSLIGIPYTKEIMRDINYFIWDILQEYSDADKKPVPEVTIFIQQFDGGEAFTYGEQINVSALYLQGYQGNLKWEFTSLLHHEMTHVFQWMGEGKAPRGLIEGVADYMILKSNYYPPGFAKPGQGERWDQGYDFTARFLEYCEELRSGFVAQLNKKIRYNYTDLYFKELTGKTVGELWSDYKAKYGNIK